MAGVQVYPGILLWQDWWEILLIVYLYLGGIAGMAILPAYYYWLRDRNERIYFVGSMIGVAAVAVGLVLLILDLTRPMYAVLAVLHPNPTSWITYGTYFLASYFVVTLLIALPFLVKFWLPGTYRIPGIGGLFRRFLLSTGWLDFLGAIATALGTAVAMYTGFVLGTSVGVQSWTATTLLPGLPVLPFLFMVGGLSCACAAYEAIGCLLAELGPSEEFRHTLHYYGPAIAKLDAVALLVETALYFLAVYLMISSGNPAAIAAAERLMFGDLAWMVWGVLVVLGVFIPLVIYLVILRRRVVDSKCVVAGIIAGWLVLIGGLMVRWTMMSAGGVLVPVAPAGYSVVPVPLH